MPHPELTLTEGQYIETMTVLSVWSQENRGVIISGLREDRAMSTELDQMNGRRDAGLATRVLRLWLLVYQ